jgi:lipopolysaccharide/colanic/teichoic acid biosynthesis glycosyltransferase
MTTWITVERPSVRLYRAGYRRLKRVFDVTLSLSALFLLGPAALIIALLIRLESNGPILYVQDRVGKGGRIFKMYKFRTMHHNIARDAHRTYMKAFINGNMAGRSNTGVFKPFEANQVTRIGRILRATSLDELPQVLNVLRGEMSIVGPRPNVAWEVEEYKGWHKERLEVLPGITGLAQVRGRSGISFNEIIAYDLRYIERQSLWFDIKILMWTFLAVVQRKGAQ